MTTQTGKHSDESLRRSSRSRRTGISSRRPSQTQRLKLIVAYDGTLFAGWQSQAHRNTIQDNLERALNRVVGKRVRIHGSGRTDAGVHALAQCAHVDLPSDQLSTEGWTKALNALLPPTIRVLRCHYVSSDFHARLSALGKVYRYKICLATVPSPFEYRSAWHLPRPIDIETLKRAAKHFVGTHDFAGFAANRGHPEKSTIRTIRSVRVRQKGHWVTIELDGDGFLYKMARLIVGALVKCALGKIDIDDLAARLKSGHVGSVRFTAPAEGLYLVRVRY